MNKLSCLILFVFAFVAFAQNNSPIVCSLDANTQTEWQVFFDGAVYNDVADTTTFNYHISTVTDRNDPRCTGINCQDLSHWDIILPCCPVIVGSSPSASCGQDGSTVLSSGVQSFGIKFEENGSSTSGDIAYSFTLNGNVVVGDVTYIVKGATRCGQGVISGPLVTGTLLGACDNVEEPECLVDSDCASNGCLDGVCSNGVCTLSANDSNCDDGYSCTDDSCLVDGTCSNVAVHTSCDDKYSCTADSCSASAGSEAGTGCVYEPVHSSCDDKYSCTDDSCSASAGSEAGTGCVYEPIHSSCDDGYSCTDDSCSPGENGSDSLSGCLITPIDANCDDGIDCSVDTCAPGVESDSNGCNYFYDHSQCTDSVECTEEMCTPNGCESTEIPNFCDDENVCTDDVCDFVLDCQYTDNTDPCDDGDECTGIVEDPDQCEDGSCQPGGDVCPETVAEVYAGQNYYAGTVTITNDADNFYFIWNADSTWSSKEFHIYVGRDRPAKSAPGKFPYHANLAENVSSAEFVIPFTSDVDCGDLVYVAFHAVVSTSEEVCLESGDCTTSGQTAWMSGPDAPPKWHQWGGYNHYEACCCAGFSHLNDILENNAIEVEYTAKTGRKSVNTQEAQELQQTLSEMLDYPASAIEIVSLVDNGDSIDAVIKFLNYGNVAGSTMVQVLYNTPQETFDEYGLENFDIQTIQTNDFDVYRNYVSSEDFSSSSSSDASSASFIQVSILLSLLVALLF